MKILCLIASPRKIGNSEICAKEIVSQLPADWEKEIINLCQLHLEPCKACYACLPAGKKCVIKDDLDSLLTKLQAADKFSPTFQLDKSILCNFLALLNNEDI